MHSKRCQSIYQVVKGRNGKICFENDNVIMIPCLIIMPMVCVFESCQGPLAFPTIRLAEYWIYKY